MSLSGTDGWSGLELANFHPGQLGSDIKVAGKMTVN
jgi:hypothetical protein